MKAPPRLAVTTRATRQRGPGTGSRAARTTGRASARHELYLAISGVRDHSRSGRSTAPQRPLRRRPPYLGAKFGRPVMFAPRSFTVHLAVTLVSTSEILIIHFLSQRCSRPEPRDLIGRRSTVRNSKAIAAIVAAASTAVFAAGRGSSSSGGSGSSVDWSKVTMLNRKWCHEHGRAGQSRVLTAELREVLLAHPCVVAWLNGVSWPRKGQRRPGQLAAPSGRVGVDDLIQDAVLPAAGDLEIGRRQADACKSVPR
jgi:hypothetical protein